MYNDEDVLQFLEKHQPHVIIHCAAERRPDVAEKNPTAAEVLNVKSVEVLARKARESGALFIYLSTDYVFDGTKPPYEVGDTPNPLNFYGRTKFQGEQAARKVNSDTVVLRVPLLYGDVETLDESAVTVLIKAVQDVGKPALMDHVATRYPTHVDDAARVIYELAKREKEVRGKTFHYTGDKSITKYEMALVMADLMGVSREHILAQTAIPANATSRPLNAHLSVKSLQDIGIDVSALEFREALKPILKKFQLLKST